MGCTFNITKNQITTSLKEASNRYGVPLNAYISFLNGGINEELNFTPEFEQKLADKFGTTVDKLSTDKLDDVITFITDEYNKFKPDINYYANKENSYQEIGKYGYTSVYARDFAKKIGLQFTISGKRFIEEKYGNIENYIADIKKNTGKTITKLEAYTRILKGRVAQTIKQRAVTNKKASIEEVSKLISSRNISKLEELFGKENSEDVNLLAFYKELIGNTDTFIEEIFRNDGNLQRLIYQNKLDNEIEESEDIESANTEEESNKATEEDDVVDNYITNLTNKLGDVGHYMSNIDDRVRLFFSTIPVLTSTETVGESYQYDTNNPLGIPDVMDATQCINVIIGYAKAANVQGLQDEIRKIAKTLPGMEGLIQVADYMKSHPSFAYKLWCNFSKTIVSKTEVTNKSNGFQASRTNIKSSREEVLKFDFINSFKQSSISVVNDHIVNIINDVNRIKALIKAEQNNLKFDTNQESIDISNKEIDNLTNEAIVTISKAFKDFFNTIQTSAIELYVKNSEDVLTTLDSLTSTLNILLQHADKAQTNYSAIRIEITNLQNKKSELTRSISEKSELLDVFASDPTFPKGKVYKEISDAKKEIKSIDEKIANLYKVDYIDSNFMSDIAAFASSIADYSLVKLDMNSRNVHGNLSSDLLNNSMITNILKTLQNPKALENFGKDKQQSRQYDFSNIMVEHRDSNGNIINYGLFTQNEVTKELTPTPYAHRLLFPSIFGGISDVKTKTGVLYAKMSRPDYITSAIFSFFNNEQTYSEKNTTDGGPTRFANYFMRIPSDAPKTFMVKAPVYSIKRTAASEGLYKNGTINKNHPVYKQFRNALVQEFQDAATAISVVFKGHTINGAIDPSVENFETGAEPTRLRRLCANYHYKGKNLFKKDKNGKLHLTGNVFSSDRFVITRTERNKDGKLIAKTTNYGKLVFDEVFDPFYGGANSIESITTDHGVEVKLNDAQNETIDKYLELYLKDYAEQCCDRATEQQHLYGENNFSIDDLVEFALNYQLTYIGFNDIFEGDSKQYKDSQTTLKRYKETQGSGVSYGVYNIEADPRADRTVFENSPLHTTTFIRRTKNIDGAITEVPFKIEQFNKFRAVTIKNTIKTGDSIGTFKLGKDGKPAKFIKDENGVLKESNKGNYIFEKPGRLSERLIKALEKEGMSKPNARTHAANIMAGYYGTTVNDAQSYITFEEWVRRITARGQFEEYKPLIDAIFDETKPLDAKAIGKFIQVQKNFYYDQHFNSDLQMFMSRQIKNAEFVLVPRLVKGTQLEEVYKMMVAAGVDQLNTEETSKAGKCNVLTIWDDNGDITREAKRDFKTNAAGAVELYDYNYLYTQQETPSHLDAKNKAAIQFMKKIIDNINETLQNGDPNPLYKYKQRFMDLYVENIVASAEEFADELGINIDEDGNFIVDDEHPLNQQLIYDLLKGEISRQGLDSNSMDYVTLDDAGLPMMPAYSGIFARKLENLVQSLVNNRVTRQTLPGFHAAQITNVGFRPFSDIVNNRSYSKDLKYHPDEYVIKNEKGEIIEKISEREWLKKSPEEQGKYTNNGASSYVEIMLPKSNFKFNRKHKDGRLKTDDELLEELRNSGADTIIGYRIPTEGKQSMCIMKVVGFLDDAYDSTIVVPDDWVSQTGSDFDIDSVYGIHFTTELDKDGKLIKATPKEPSDIDYIRFVRRKIKDTLKDAKIDTSIKQALSDEIEKYINENSDQYDILNSEAKGFYSTMKYSLQNRINKYNNVEHEGKTKQERYIKKLAYVIRQLNDDIKNDTSLSKKEKLALTLYNRKLGEIYTFIKSQKEDFIDTVDSIKNRLTNEIIAKIDDKARAAGLPSYEKWKERRTRSINRDIRNNELLNIAITILSDDSCLEENLSRSNFEKLKDARDDVQPDYIKDARKNRSPYNFFDQAAYQEDVTSGLTLKGASVARDTFVSICNTVKPFIADTSTIQVVYKEEDGYTLKKLQAIFPNVKDNRNGTFTVTHNTLGWTKNNKNVDDLVLTPYTSQTTAHILDAVKEGPIPNVNNYTFNVYKTFSDIGCDFYMSVAFMMQPAVTKIVELNNRKNSVFITDSNINPVKDALVEIANKLNPKYEYTSFSNLKEIINDINEIYKEIIAERYGGDINSHIMDFASLNDRLKDESESIENLLHDFKVVLDFKHLKSLSTEIGNNARLLNPDKFGAKQTVFETIDVTRKISDAKRKANPILYTIDENGNKTSLINSIYTNNDNDSSYKTLNAFYKYSTQLSLKLQEILFPAIHNKYFDFYLLSIGKVLYKELDSDTYETFKRYVINYASVFSNAISKPVTINAYGSLKFDEAADSREELARIYGLTKSIYLYVKNEEGKTVIFDVKDINHPTEEEVRQFYTLSPAQKVNFIKRTFEKKGIFEYIDESLANRGKLGSKQTLTYNENASDIETIYSEFEKAFFSNNPIIKLAAIDLIKYSYVVEGSKMKKGAITKVIKNNALYTSTKDGGLSLIQESNDILNTLIDIEGVDTQNELITNFIRSHSDLIPAKKIRSHETGQFRNNDKTKPILIKDLIPTTKGIIKVPDIETAIKYGFIITDDEGAIVAKRSFARLIDGDTTTLYKINEIIISNNGIDNYSYILTPLNLLEENESLDMSVNNDNNKFNSESWYNAVIEDYQSKVIEQQKEIKELEDQGKIDDIDTVIKNPKYSLNSSISTLLAQSDLAKYYIKEVNNKKYAKPFDINSKDTPHTSGFEAVINSIIDRFDVNGEKLLVLRSPALSNYIRYSGKEFGSVQIINGKKYLIYKANFINRNKSYITEQNPIVEKNNDIKEIFEQARKDKQPVNDAFYVQQINDNIRYSSTDEYIIEDAMEKEDSTEDNFVPVASNIFYNSTEELNAIPTIDTFNHKAVETMYFRRRSLNDERAVESIKYIESKNLNNDPEYINNNRKLITQINSDYIVNSVNHILNRLHNFQIGKHNYRLDSDEVIEAVRKDKSLQKEFLQIILDARAFVKNFDIIDKIDITSEDPEIKKHLDDIKHAIDKLRSSNIISNCEVKFGNDVLAKLSDNTLIQKGILGVFDGYHSASFFDAWVNDLQETSNPLLQIVSSQVMKDLRKKEMLAQKEVREFRKSVADIKAKAAKAGVKIDWDHIIDKDGKFIQSFNQAFLDKLQELRDKKDKAKAEFDTNPKAYYEAKLAFDKWKLENIEQEAKNEYYARAIRLDEFMFDHYAPVFIKYKTIQAKIGELRAYISGGSFNTHHAEELDKLQKELDLLSSDFIGDDTNAKYSFSDPNNPYPLNDERRAIYSLEAAAALRKYKRNKSELESEYFEYKANFNFDKELERNLGIISNREIRDGNGKLLTPMEELMQDPDYVAAKDWIANNTYFTHSSEIRTKVFEAFRKLRESVVSNKTSNLDSNYVHIIAKLRSAYDQYGVVNASLLDDADIAIIKQRQENEYQINETNPFSDRTLITNAPNDDVVFSSKFYNRMKSNGVSNPLYIAKVKEINNILRNHYDSTTKTVNTSELSTNELIALDRLYSELNNLKKNEEGTSTNGKSIHEFIENNVEFVYNYDKLHEEESKAIAIANSMEKNAGREYLRKWRSVNNEIIIDKNGNRQVVPNHFLYGYAVPKGYKQGQDNKYIDHEKTNALRYIKEHSSVIPTEYYHKKYSEMKNKSEDEFKAWFDANHIYNPYTHRLEPLKCWTTLEIHDENEKILYSPTFNYRNRVVRDDKKNDKYIPNAGYAQNYNKSNPDYNNTIIQNQYEKELSDLFKEKIQKYALTDQAKSFFKQGYAPLKAKKEEVNARKIGKELLKFIGYVNTATGKEDWLEDKKVDYSNDATLNMPMTALLKNKETVKVKQRAPKRKENQTDEEYNEIYNKWRTEKQEAIDKNKEINRQLIDKNWESVMEEFITRASAFNAVQDNKYMLFYAKNMIDNQKIYVKNLGFNKLQKTGQKTVEGNVEYASKTDENLKGQYINWLRRIIYEQYKKPNNKVTRIANVIQSATSAKYMMLNFSGGVANVTQGWNQILGERFARDYFGRDNWYKGVSNWNSSSWSFILDLHKDNASTKYSAIAKAFNIVDFTEINGLVNIPDAAEYISKVRDAAFGTLSIGEHFMQNSALFAMLHSHRLYKQSDAKNNERLSYTYKSLGQAKNEAFDAAFKDYIAGTEFEQKYNEFVKYETSKPDSKKEYVWYREDFTTKFVTIYMKNKMKEWEKMKKDVEKRTIEDFNNDDNHPTLMSQLDISKDGYMIFKEGSKMATDMTEEDAFELLAGFKGRVISVNKKIHGIYDRLGAAQFENKWIGSLVMQYHKHLYPGIMKRWRRQGYFNEERGTVEKGTNVALFDFIALPFNNYKFVKKLKADNNMSDSQLNSIEGFQNICKEYVQFVTNMKLYFNMLPRYEQANILRGFADLTSVALAITGAVALQVLGSDDEDGVLYNFLINQADRLATESMSFRSLGIIGEGKKLWSSPIAGQNLIEDTGKLLSLCAQYVMEGDEFEPEYTSGIYKGENKFTMILKRNTPIIHSIQMLTRLQKNNKAYKLDENMLSIIPVKKIADSIKD